MLKTLIALSIAAAVLAVASPSSSTEKAAPRAKKRRLLRHVVLFKFKKAATRKQIAQVVQAFDNLPKRIDAIVDYEHGTDMSTENLSKGFTHCFFVTFRDAKGRDAYLPHPAHKEFVKLVKPLLDDVLVVDYLTRE